MKAAGLLGAGVCSLAFAVGAQADTFCVNDSGCVSAGGTSSPSVGAALASAAGNIGDDSVVIGPGTYSDGPFIYGGGNGAVTVTGAGQGQTVLTMPIGNAADPSRTVLDINPNVAGSVVSDLTVELPASAPSDQDFDMGIFLRNAELRNVALSATDATTYADGVATNDTTRLDHVTVDFPLSGTLGDTAIRAGGAPTIVDSDLTTEGSAIYHFGGDRATVYRDRITVGDGPYAGQGVEVSDGTAIVRDTLIDIGPGFGYGLNAEPLFGGDDAKIKADHVTIVGGGSTSVGARASAHLSVDGGSQSASLTLANSVISGAHTDLLRFAGNPSVNNPGTNVANMTVDYSIFDSTNTQNAANGSGTLTTSHQVGATADFMDSHFRPAKGSSMIDSGKPAFKPGQFSSDLDGGDRVVDGNRDGKAVTDLGAYEFQQPTVKIKGIRVKGHHARLRYTAADYTTLRCRIDHVKWEVCPVPHTTYTHLKPGRHRFRIRATNNLYHAKAVATKRFRVRL